jgi:hypothetical protein
MPHEFVLLTAREPDLRAIAQAVAATGLPLEPVVEREGMQAVLRDAGASVLTITRARALAVPGEAARLLTGVVAPPDAAWWTDAILAPRADPEVVGVLAALASVLGGVAVDLAPEWIA